MDDPRYVRVVCPTCRAVLHPRVEKAGRRVQCPDCYSAVLVPQPPEPEAAPKQRDAGEYRVRDERAPARPEKESEDFFPILCPTCNARLHPKRAHVGKRARCPDCDTVFVIPPPAKAEAKAPPPAPGKYAVGVEPKREQPKFHYLTVEREPEPEPAAPPDRWWFAAGVFTFPWWPGAWQRWLILAMLFVPALGMAGVVAWLLTSFAPGHPMTMAVRAFMAPLVLLWLWALSYAAGCFLAIVEDTGCGNDEVSSWPEGDWRDRVVTMLYIGLHVGLATAAAWALAWPVAMFYGPVWMGLAVILAVNFLFPLSFLSSMEAGTLLSPYSPVILRSVWKVLGGWVMVYIESLFVLTLTTVLLAAGLYFLPILTILLAAPLLATAIFIVARLYGRLAWHIGQAEVARRPRKRKKKDGPRGKSADRAAKLMPSKG